MNQITQILQDMPIEKLQEAVREMKELADTGILRDGVVRQLASDISAQVHVPHTDAQSIAQTKVLERAAFLWAGI